MTDKMSRFLTSIGLTDFDRFDLDFDVVMRNTFKNEQIDMVIIKQTPWSYPVLSEFLNAIYQIPYPCTFKFNYRIKPSPEDIYNLFDNWYQSSFRFPHTLEKQLNNENLEFVFASASEKQQYEQAFIDFEDLLKFIYYPNPITYRVKELVPVVDPQTMENLKKKADEIIEAEEDSPFIDVDDENADRIAEAEEILVHEMEENYKQMEEQRRQRSVFKRGDYVESSIDLLTIKSGSVDVNGTIFSIESYENYKGKRAIRAGLANKGKAILFRCTEDGNLKRDFLNSLKVGDHIRLRGAVDREKERFGHEGDLYILGHFIDLLPEEPLRSDDAIEKRVELHLHTKMSTMDGLGNIDAYCRLAKNMGHEAIAVTDHGVVQAFPAAQTAANTYGLKMIYGSELYMIEDALEYVINPAPRILSNATYVVFDLETTGLSSMDDHIIEFGAVRITKGMVTGNLDIIINPGNDVPIRAITTEITGLSRTDFVGKKLMGEAIDEILEFIDDAILVTHNARFDFGFLSQALVRLGRPKLKNPVIDTISLSRNLFPDSEKHRLGSLARKMEVPYDEEKAHRADYDAGVLADIWQAMLSIIIEEKKITTHEQLNALVSDSRIYKQFYPKHVVALVKNPQGLKDLFHIISLSHTQYWAEVPRIPRFEINKYRKNLLIGSACFNSEIFELAKTRTEDELIAAMAFYDYIELQPIENYSYLVNMGDFDSQDHLISILSRIARCAKIANKMIVATGDCHYVNPEEKLFRDVYIYANGLKNVSHPMYPYSRKSKPKFENPNQHYRSTKEMLSQFSWMGETQALEAVVKNTRYIASLIEPVNPIRKGLHTPKIENSDSYLTQICWAKAKATYGENLPENVSKRLETELNGIIKHGYSVIYYIAHKIIKKSYEDGYIVGSRGSVGSSFAATMADITEVNPLPPHYLCPKCYFSDFTQIEGIRSGFDLPERKCPTCGTLLKRDGQNIPFAIFLGIDANKVPDIDLNFSPDYQGRAHDYTRELLGNGNVYRAGTIDKVADKMAYGYVRAYFEKMGIDIATVSNAEQSYLAINCQGVKRTTGQHPGGLVVVPFGYEMEDFTPVQYPADRNENNNLTTHFDFESMHDTVLKLDLLGHVDPSALSMMSSLTGIKIQDVPLTDPEALSIFSSDKALKRKHKIALLENGAAGIPEFGTVISMKILQDTKPKKFADLLLVSGLSHGKEVWFGNSKNLVDSGEMKLSEVIGCRDDIMTYLVEKGISENQSFHIMEDVRKGKHVKKEYEVLMKAHNVPDYYIGACNKIKYMFPKAHATAYVMMAVRVAWFKINYPLEYYATYFTLRSKQYELETMMKTASEIYDRIEFFRTQVLKTKGKQKTKSKEGDIELTLQMALEMVERGYKFLNIDLNKSDATKFVIDREKNALIPPFIVINGVGETAAYSVLTARNERPFASRDDLLQRTKLSGTNVENLVALGALDTLQENDHISLFSF